MNFDEESKKLAWEMIGNHYDADEPGGHLTGHGGVNKIAAKLRDAYDQGHRAGASAMQVKAGDIYLNLQDTDSFPALLEQATL